jgi:hypothetical protein
LYGAPARDIVGAMSRCQCEEIEDVFDKDLAKDELRKLHRRGPARTTRILLEALASRGVRGKSLLDIGGGVGAIQHSLLAAGASSAVDVDASSAFLKTAEKEARRLGLDGRVTFHHGNFVALAPRIPAADIVTLDRVICCYDDARALVTASAGKARSLYGVVYPTDSWWSRLVIWILNLSRKIHRDNFRVFAHPTSLVESILAAHGFTRTFHRPRLLWQVAVFEKKRKKK